MTVEISQEKADLIFDALCKANNSVACTNGEAALGLLMFFEQISKVNPHMLPIVIGAWENGKKSAEANPT